MISTLKILLYFLQILCVSAYTLKKLGSFPIRYPAFTNLYLRDNGRYDLLMSTFSANPFVRDSIQYVPNIGSLIKDVSSIEPTLLTNQVVWPNEVAGVPEYVFNKSMVAVPDGFLVPFKTDGSISLIDISDGADPKGPYKLTDDSAGQWFYHRVIWKDMDGDHMTDAVVCRAREPAFGSGKDSELLWLKNPGTYNTVWEPHVIAHGPDTFFRNARLPVPGNTLDVILTAQFFSQSLSIYWTESKLSLWNSTDEIKSRVIDNTIGDVFDVLVADLNGDHKLDLLVSNNGAEGALYAYEVPEDFRTGNFTRHTIATGFKPRISGTGKGAPGAPGVIYPNVTATENVKPWILLSGDDDGTAYTFEPTSSDPSHWGYNMTTFLDAGQGTVGELSFADVDGDNFTEIFAPSYNTNEIFVYKFTE